MPRFLRPQPFWLRLFLGGLIGLAVFSARLTAQPFEASPPEPAPKQVLEQAFEKALAGGYLTRFPDGQAHLDQPVSRAALATVLVKAFDLTRRAPALTPPAVLHDVPQDYWAKPAIDTVVSRDIMGGYRAGRFYPDQPVSRAEGFAILAQAYGVYPFSESEIETLLAPFADQADVPLWARKALATALSEGFMPPSAANRLNAASPMTRGDLATAMAWWVDRQQRPHPAKGL